MPRARAASDFAAEVHMAEPYHAPRPDMRRYCSVPVDSRHDPPHAHTATACGGADRGRCRVDAGPASMEASMMGMRQHGMKETQTDEHDRTATMDEQPRLHPLLLRLVIVEIVLAFDELRHLLE